MTFGAKITCNDRRISLSNEVKVLKMGTKVTSLQVTSTFALGVFRYFKNVTRFYSKYCNALSTMSSRRKVTTIPTSK